MSPLCGNFFNKNYLFMYYYKRSFLLTATDYANRSTAQTSPPVIIDNTHPVKTDNPITISGRHITSDSEIEAW